MFDRITWEQAGAVISDLISKNYYPGIGYDSNGWEAWVFFDEPIEGMLGENAKGEGDTILEALSNLLKEIERISK